MSIMHATKGRNVCWRVDNCMGHANLALSIDHGFHEADFALGRRVGESVEQGADLFTFGRLAERGSLFFGDEELGRFSTATIKRKVQFDPVLCVPRPLLRKMKRRTR